MPRSTRLLALGVAVLATALVLLAVGQRQQPQPVVVADAAVDTGAQDAAPQATTTVGALDEDGERLPTPLAVPDGHEAVAVSSAYDAAVAGLPVPGDRVNVYAVFQQDVPDVLADDGTDTAAKGVVRALSGVEVLGVAGVQPEAGAGNVTLVLALAPGDAERTIYLAAAEQVWFSLVALDHEPVPGAGVTRATVLAD